MAWQRFEHPAFGLTFCYPDPTPQGHPVERHERRFRDHRGDADLFHLSSPASGELYVEIGVFRGITPEQEYANHKPHLQDRFGAEAVTALTETRVGDRPASTYGIRWKDSERTVLLLQAGADTYRLIYDPRSPLNEQVVETVVFLDR